MDDRFHRSLRFRHAWIGAIAVDLVAGEFGLRELAGDDDGASTGIHLDGMLIRGFEREAEQRPQHFYHVIVGMLVVIEQDDVVEWREAFGFGSSGVRSGDRGWQLSNGRMKWKGGATDSTGLIPSWEVVPGSELP